MKFHNFYLCSSNFSVAISLCSWYLSVSLPASLQHCFVASHTLQGCSLLEVAAVAVLQRARALLHSAACWAAPLPRGGPAEGPAEPGFLQVIETSQHHRGASAAPDPCTEHPGTLINNPTCSFQAVYKLFSASWVQCCQEHSTCVYE